MLTNHKSVRKNNAIVLISCVDARGITAAVTRFIYEHDGNIMHADQHIDERSNTFFMRVEWSMDGFNLGKEEIVNAFGPIADNYGMDWELYFTDEPARVAIFTGKHLHCLIDLLFRQMAGQFACEIPVIISNHSYARAIAEEFDIDFVEMPVTPANKAGQEAKQIQILRDYDVDLVVLARYHQVFSGAFIDAFPDQIINIHHSFLPAFEGANPYRQAYDKGVKLIGATSHYVVEELDSGPIIAQETVQISHRDQLEDLVRKGEDLEKVVLNRAVRLALERKILRYGNKTVVFE
jgi:formyltetrahydrofolate deformylase